MSAPAPLATKSAPPCAASRRQLTASTQSSVSGSRASRNGRSCIGHYDDLQYWRLQKWPTRGRPLRVRSSVIPLFPARFEKIEVDVRHGVLAGGGFVEGDAETRFRRDREAAVGSVDF